MRITIAVVMMLACVMNVSAKVEMLSFTVPENEARYKKLTAELRCMVCQNQNIASSNADLAKDLRQQVYTHIKKGQSDEEIIAFMVARYGEFVLYRPRLNARTALLWLGPFVLLVGGMFLMIRLMRRTGDGDAPISEGSMNRARALLKKNSKTP
jgi:cytochrome c-type biogenesis protein CcmH